MTLTRKPKKKGIRHRDLLLSGDHALRWPIKIVANIGSIIILDRPSNILISLTFTYQAPFFEDHNTFSDQVSFRAPVRHESTTAAPIVEGRRCQKLECVDEESHMPRYYFHIRKGDVLVEDQDGTEVSEAGSVEEEAVEAARDLLADGDREGPDRREWVYEVADATGATVLLLPFEAADEADFSAAASAEDRSPTDTACPRCSGSGTECEAVAVLGEATLASLKASNAVFSGDGSRVDMRCTLCSGSGLVTAKVEGDIAWAKGLLEQRSAAGRREWSPERRSDRARLLRLVRNPRLT